MLHEHSVARGLVVYDNSEEKRKKGGKKAPFGVRRISAIGTQAFSLLFIRETRMKQAELV